MLDQHGVTSAVHFLHHLPYKRHDRASALAFVDFLDNQRVFRNNLVDPLFDLIAGNYTTSEAKLFSNLLGHACISVDNRHHHLLSVGNRDRVFLNEANQVDQALVPEVEQDGLLEIQVFLLTVAQNVLVNPKMG